MSDYHLPSDAQPKNQNTVLHVFLHAEEIEPGKKLQTPCPIDPSHRLVIRKNKATGEHFAGCDHFPPCNGAARIVVQPKEQPRLL